MPKKKPRKTEKGADQGSYSRDTLTLAVQNVKNGNISMRAAAILHNIPRSTLRHYVHGTRGKGIVSQGGVGGGGRNQLTIECEDQLVKCLRTLEKLGFGLCRDEVLDFVQAFVMMNGLTTRFKNGRPGKDWFINFKERHKLSVKKPQEVKFFDLLEKIVKENNLEGKPQRFYNCDETVFSKDPSRTKEGENTTVLVTTSAAGHKLPILCVFKGKNILEGWINNETHRVAYDAAKREWMDGVIFCMWFKKVFIPNILNERPVVLLFDSHVTHITAELIETAAANNIILLKLPPHTTHVHQPLDVAVFKSIKTCWDRKLSQWRREHPRRKIPQQEFVRILTVVYEETPAVNIINGFQVTGIYNPDLKGPDRKRAELNCKFKAYNVVPRRRKMMDNSLKNIPTNKSVESSNCETVEHLPLSNLTVSSSSSQITKAFKTIIIDTFQGRNNSVSTGRKRLCSGAAILTADKRQASTRSLNNKTWNKKAQKRPQKKKVKHDSRGEEGYENSTIESSSSYRVGDSDSDEPIVVIKDDYVLVDYFGKTYPGQVTDLKNGNVQVKHMQNAGEFNWKWPENEDILWYAGHDILKLIQPPKLINKRGIYSVEGLKGFSYT